MLKKMLLSRLHDQPQSWHYLETCWLIAEASDLAFEDQHAASLFVLPYIRAFMQD